MPAKVEKSVKVVVPFENGLRNGGGRVTYDSATGTVEIFYSSRARITCSLPQAENVSDAVRKLVQVVTDQGFDK